MEKRLKKKNQGNLCKYSQASAIHQALQIHDVRWQIALYDTESYYKSGIHKPLSVHRDAAREKKGQKSLPDLRTPVRPLSLPPLWGFWLSHYINQCPQPTSVWCSCGPQLQHVPHLRFSFKGSPGFRSKFSDSQIVCPKAKCLTSLNSFIFMWNTFHWVVIWRKLLLCRGHREWLPKLWLPPERLSGFLLFRVRVNIYRRGPCHPVWWQVCLKETYLDIHCVLCKWRWGSSLGRV